MCVFTPNTNGAFHYFWKMERILTPSVCGKKETHAVKQRLHFFFCFTEFSWEACPKNHALCTPQKLNDTSFACSVNYNKPFRYIFISISKLPLVKFFSSSFTIEGRTWVRSNGHINHIIME